MQTQTRPPGRESLHGMFVALIEILETLGEERVAGLTILRQLAVAVESASGVAKLRVWHGSGADLAGAEIHSAIARAWVRHAPIPAADGGVTMLDLTDAADLAGLSYPTTDLGLRARWTRSDPAAGATLYELPLWRRG
ncbi:hypothetical protein AB1046_06745 [Promicromonospora sp. Populi]|uniref:hypothetical protein n=1 Tax=Promicromonospora sp. Populi TaxID=3239420 RepID=UPI0034E289CA